MMTFCKKSVHSFLSLSNPLLHIDTNSYTTCSDEKPPPSQPGGLGLITGETEKVPNVLAAAKVKKERDDPVPVSKKDPGGIGFIDDIGGGVDGLMSCTESLGFESCDERRADDEMLELSSGDSAGRSMSKVIKRRNVRESREVKKFPPPLSSLNPNGQPCFFLRPLRRDGRLELTEVRIDRPEILRASREGGRLRLHLIRDEEETEEEEEQRGEEDQLLVDNDNNYYYYNQDHNDNILEEDITLELQDNQEKDGFDEDEKSDEERRVSPARNTVINNNNGESPMRRCHKGAAVRHVHHRGHHLHGNHRNDHLHVWSQQCVTTCR